LGLRASSSQLNTHRILRARKNSCSNSAHFPANTPPRTSI